MRNTRKGSMLIGLLLVVAIIGIVITMGWGNGGEVKKNSFEQGRESIREAEKARQQIENRNNYESGGN